ncbi:MAG: glycosyltransferase family 4 protein [Flavobacteriaceae bacterium]|nr:glycosyltransferase family 4 protein [Bacteroidia bacterium]NNF75190.1 glycosyltransferase family 4 protein [Flavobacteriaceae bacterium]NNK72437.1 glycosyltransferase family 4 protein [Flavobacteriaceae bacterium]
MGEILVITNYYPPETGAASNRIYHLAHGLHSRGFSLTVLAPLPNYPRGKIFEDYRGHFRVSRNEDGIKIHRLWVLASNSKNKIIRLVAMLSFSFSLCWYFLFNKIPETVIIQSPPLLVAHTALWFLKSKSRKMVLNVSDLWPLAGLKLGAFKHGFMYSALERIERANYKKADLIMGQSEEILEHVRLTCPDKKVMLYRNYPDIKFNLNIEHDPSEKIKLVYAGLLGVAQGIFNLCERLNYKGYEFHIYGQGAEKNEIEKFITSNPELPLYYHGELERSILHKELVSFDVAIIPLLNRIYGSVPSKIFELAKLGLPILYFGGGEGEGIVNRHELGWVAKAGDYEDLNKVLNQISPDELSSARRKTIRATADVNFDFNQQLDKLIKFLEN